MAIGCDGCEALFEGISKTCDNNVGGIVELYLTEKCNVESVTLSSPEGEIESFNGSPTPTFYKFEFNKNTSTFTEVTANDPANGTTIVTQTITLKLARREKSKRDTIALLGAFKDLVAIAKDANGIYWYFGEENGLNMTENNSETGTARGDFNGYTITFVAEESAQANTAEEAAVLAVI